MPIQSSITPGIAFLKVFRFIICRYVDRSTGFARPSYPRHKGNYTSGYVLLLNRVEIFVLVPLLCTMIRVRVIIGSLKATAVNLPISLKESSKRRTLLIGVRLRLQRKQDLS